MQDSEIDWQILERLRSGFLNKSGDTGVYWQSESDLACYHETFAARIGWKWDNALAAASQVGFQPASRRLLDWGCGSGIASLRVIEHFGAEAFDEVILWDHSTLACRFAQSTLQAAYRNLKVTIAAASDQDAFTGTLTLISHALNELGYEAQEQLSRNLSHASQILFVEPGDYTASRKLIAQRQALGETFAVIAPCTHCNSCPMLAEENQRHWCHFFGDTPVEAYTEGRWTRFSQIMEIDLRSLPYSFLALQSKSIPASEQAKPLSRLIGRPRQFKGYTRLLSCDAQGLRELELQKRDDKPLWKSLKKETAQSLYLWAEVDSASRIKSGEACYEISRNSV